MKNKGKQDKRVTVYEIWIKCRHCKTLSYAVIEDLSIALANMLCQKCHKHLG